MTQDIPYIEFFEPRDKVRHINENKFGIVMKTFELNNKGRVIGGSLIVLWDTHILQDFQNCTGDIEPFLRKVNDNHVFKYINDDGTRKKQY